MVINKMDKEEFWKLIESSLIVEDSYEQMKFLEKVLGEKYSKEDVASFDEIFSELSSKLYNTNTMIAAIILRDDDLDDDKFWNFRDWIVSCGKDFYEKVLENPDNLVDAFSEFTTLEEIENADIMPEGFSYISSHIFENKYPNDDIKKYLKKKIFTSIVLHIKINLKLDTPEYREKTFPKITALYNSFK